MERDGKKRLCVGCRDDFYNEPGNSTTGECWLLKKAKEVIRYRIGWWTAPTQPGAFARVRVLSCYNQPGRFGYYVKLPDFAVGVRDETGGAA